MRASRIEYPLPADAYSRPGKLIAEFEGGTIKWSIVSEAVSQRDEGERIRSLTTEQLVEAGHIAEMVAKGKAP